MRRQRFQISPDLVADIAVAGNPVGSNNTKIDFVLLHQQAAGVVGDDRVRHPVVTQFEGGQRCALIAWPGLVDPYMHRDTLVVRQVNGCQRRPVINCGEPTRITVREDLYGAAGIFACHGIDELHAMLANRPVGVDVLVADRPRTLVSGDHAAFPGGLFYRRLHSVQGPSEVHRRRASCEQCRVVTVQGRVRRIGAQSQAEAVGRRRANQGRATRPHFFDGARRGLDRGELRDLNTPG
jgi:hypothetical protein